MIVRSSFSYLTGRTKSFMMSSETFQDERVLGSLIKILGGRGNKIITIEDDEVLVRFSLGELEEDDRRS